MAAAAAGLAAATVGVETDAATTGHQQRDQQRVDLGARRAAAAGGAAAMRPTFGLVSRTGVLPTARSQETPAPVGRTVADVAAVAERPRGPRRRRRDDRERARRGARLRRRAEQDRARRASGSA